MVQPVPRVLTPGVRASRTCCCSFYSMVSAAGIAQGLKSLAAGGTPPRLLIIDDGWQQTDVDPRYRQAGGCWRQYQQYQKYQQSQ